MKKKNSWLNVTSSMIRLLPMELYGCGLFFSSTHGTKIDEHSNSDQDGGSLKWDVALAIAKAQQREFYNQIVRDR